jgi:sugar phosphate isomerase/epimerase
MRNAQDNHAHDDSRYKEIGWPDYAILLKNIIEVRLYSYISLNVHLPFEVQHPSVYPCLKKGLMFIRFGERMKRIFNIRLYWENAPAQNYGTWNLKNGQTQWEHIPETIDLCLDTGHVMLEARSVEEARRNIVKILKKRGKQIKHLHVHENDLLHDTHNPIGKVITKKLLADLTYNRTYIFEKG